MIIKLKKKPRDRHTEVLKGCIHWDCELFLAPKSVGGDQI